MSTEFERFNTNREDLCRCLQWKSMFIPADHDPSVQASNEGLFWCQYTQTCIGPDGQLAEPGNCSSPERPCYGTGEMPAAPETEPEI